MATNLYIECPCGNKLYVNYMTPEKNDQDCERIVTCKCGADFALEYYRSDEPGLWWAAERVSLDDQRGMIAAILWRRGQN